ncbi:MAG: LytR/AlgR family response regulator transcription factor, partial [Chitinophagales bacterium]
KEYALEGYELNIEDYLLKPFGFDRFLKALNKAFGSPKPQSLPSNNNPDASKRIFLRSNKKYIQVEVDKIQYIEASGNYTKVVNRPETIVIREKISDVLALLPKQDFLQVHKSFAVAISHIKNIEGNRIVIGEDFIPIGKMYKSGVNRLLK